MKAQLLSLLRVLAVTAVLFAILLFVFPPKAHAEPADPATCVSYAQFAVIARALAQAKVDQKQADVVLHGIYDYDSMDNELREVATLLAARSRVVDVPPAEFATQIFFECTHKGLSV